MGDKTDELEKNAKDAFEALDEVEAAESAHVKKYSTVWLKAGALKSEKSAAKLSAMSAEFGGDGFVRELREALERGCMVCAFYRKRQMYGCFVFEVNEMTVSDKTSLICRLTRSFVHSSADGLGGEMRSVAQGQLKVRLAEEIMFSDRKCDGYEIDGHIYMFKGNKTYLLKGTMIGLVLGVMYGIILDNLALGICFGVCFGMALSMALFGSSHGRGSSVSEAEKVDDASTAADADKALISQD